jgi:hypothetical protein
MSRRKKPPTSGRPSHNSKETHEPDEPIDWPRGHVRVELTGDDQEECITVWIHGRTHYLHSTTARELQKMLETRLAEWNKIAVADGWDPV